MTDRQLHANLLAKGPYARTDAPYRLLEVAGPDAGEFLQRLCSQDVQPLTEGQLLPAAFLDAKGKLQATALVFRTGPSFWLETHEEQAERLTALLDRYHFTEKLTITLRPSAGCTERIELAADGAVSAAEVGDGGNASLRYVRHCVQFSREHGAAAAPISGEPLSPELAECARMLAGIVRVGVETEASTLALEADLDDHCSTTKGCYTGQEIVARIHTYGHVNRKLCLLQLAAGDPITEPVPLHETEDDLPVGRVMHAIPVPGHTLRLGLGYLPTDFQAIGTKLTLAGDGAVEVVGF